MSARARAALIALCAVCATAVALPATAAAAPPSNDDFANAIVLTGLPVSTTGTNVEATEEPDEL